MEREDLRNRLTDLMASLEAVHSGDLASWQLAQIFNALLAEVQKQFPDDPVVEVIKPAQEGSTGFSTSTCGTLRAAAQQLIDVIGDGGSVIAQMSD